MAEIRDKITKATFITVTSAFEEYDFTKFGESRYSVSSSVLKRGSDVIPDQLRGPGNELIKSVKAPHLIMPSVCRLSESSF